MVKGKMSRMGGIEPPMDSSSEPVRSTHQHGGSFTVLFHYNTLTRGGDILSEGDIAVEQIGKLQAEREVTVATVLGVEIQRMQGILLHITQPRYSHSMDPLALQVVKQSQGELSVTSETRHPGEVGIGQYRRCTL